jgi:hypothetical protein
LTEADKQFKKFRNKYDLELIPAANSNIILGNLVWDPIIGKPDFSHRGMPNHIANAFVDADLINQDELTQLLDEAKNEDLIEAGFAERIIDVDVSLVNSLDNKAIDNLSQSFELSSVKKFTFGDLQARSMSNLLRVRIDDYLEDLKKNKWENYDGKIRRVFMITELYYGSMKIVINSNLKNDFETSITAANLNVKSQLEIGRSMEYTFDHQSVPFAMRIERIKHYNA